MPAETGTIQSPKSEKLTANEMAETIAAYSGSSKKQAKQFLRAFVDVVSENLGEGRSVFLQGLGTFQPKYRESQSGISVNGKPYTTPPEYLVRFKPHQSLRNYLKFDGSQSASAVSSDLS